MRNKISMLLQELTKDGMKSFFNPVTGFGYIFIRSDSHLKGRQSYIQEGMTLIKSLKELITMHIKWSSRRIFSTFYFQCCWLESFWCRWWFSDSKTNPFDEGEDDMDHGVPNVSTRPITRSKAKKIQQAFILHLQNWIGSVQLLFHVLQAY